MLGTPPVPNPFAGFVRRLQEWPVASQQQARRNAMIASTACAQRRSEREDVADFFASLTAAPAVAAAVSKGRTAHA